MYYDCSMMVWWELQILEFIIFRRVGWKSYYATRIILFLKSTTLLISFVVSMEAHTSPPFAVFIFLHHQSCRQHYWAYKIPVIICFRIKGVYIIWSICIIRWKMNYVKDKKEALIHPCVLANKSLCMPYYNNYIF